MSSPPIGLLKISDIWGEFNNVLFAVRQAISKVQTATLVKVISCTNDGDVSPVGSVNVQILVNQQNGAGVGIPEGQLVNLPYLRIQGGANAVIMDPQPGDIGIALFASRDISAVIATKAQANPPTFRMYDFSDGMYLGGLLNGVPSQYVQFSESGIAVVSPNQVTLQAPMIVLDGDVSVSGDIMTTGDGTIDGVDIKTHVHGGVTSGSADTGPPL